MGDPWGELKGLILSGWGRVSSCFIKESSTRNYLLNCMFIYSFIIQQLLILVELTREELIHKSMKSRCATSQWSVLMQQKQCCKIRAAKSPICMMMIGWQINMVDGTHLMAKRIIFNSQEKTDNTVCICYIQATHNPISMHGRTACERALKPIRLWLPASFALNVLQWIYNFGSKVISFPYINKLWSLHVQLLHSWCCHRINTLFQRSLFYKALMQLWCLSTVTDSYDQFHWNLFFTCQALHNKSPRGKIILLDISKVKTTCDDTM